MAERIDRFTDWLVGRVAGDRALRAALRRGLGQPIGAAPEVLVSLAPRVQGMPWWQEQVAYIIAPMFALHPMNTDNGNLGDHLRMLRGPNDEALERRFGVLLAAHADELDVYLRQAISMLKQKDIPVNWHQLFYDAAAWSHPEMQNEVRRRWANSFFRVPAPDEAAGDPVDAENE